MSDTCATCRFFFDEGKGRGQCRRRLATTGDVWFCTVMPDMWCGEHEPKRDAAKPSLLGLTMRLAEERRENLALTLDRAEKAEAGLRDALSLIQGMATAVTVRECPEVTPENMHRVADEVLGAASKLRAKEVSGE